MESLEKMAVNNLCRQTNRQRVTPVTALEVIAGRLELSREAVWTQMYLDGWVSTNKAVSAARWSK